MTSINNIVSNALNNYYNNATASSATTKVATATKDYTGTMVGKYLASETPETADAKVIFQKLSVDVGGDGKSITKSQLDSYINEAKSGKVTISDKEMSALTDMQKNWKTVADGGDKITYANISKAGYQDTLTSMAPDKAATTDYAQSFADSTAAAYSKVVVAALQGINTTGSTDKSSMTSMLNTLLTGTTDVHDDANANMIATLTNLIAQSKATSTTEHQV